MQTATATKAGPSLGTGAVFLTTISTILGAILFLRFGYAVGNIGLLGALAVIVLGHVVTLPTALAITEIATNQRVAGGGAYHIISRSFGIVIGAAVGLALYLSQAISVAFYVIAFAEAFKPLFAWMKGAWGIGISEPRLISVPAALGLLGLIWWKGAGVGVKALYGVVVILFASLLLFFLGSSDYDAGSFTQALTVHKEGGDSFFLVFAIIFPAFTGVAAGLGLSGDLKDPKRSIPMGTMLATFVGAVVYVLVAIKLAYSAPPGVLDDQFAMASIAIWGPAIPIGLGCAAISSALGSILVAPRTLQALAADEVLPLPRISTWLRKQAPKTGEPINAALVTTGIALVFILIGDVDFVAQIISMFFMVTYGAICLISFLEHFAADPSYRPSFRSRWYLSLTGALACVWCMFEMSPLYAFLAIASMFALFLVVAHFNPERRGLTSMFQGAVFQFSRQLQVFAQKSTVERSSAWRPSVVAISRDSFRRLDEFEILKWIAHRYGFGTYIHHIEGYFSKSTGEESADVHARLVARAEASRSNVYVDTIVSPSSTTLIAQVIQLPGISGKANNMLLFGYERDRDVGIDDLVDNYQMVVAAGFDVAVLGTSPRGFGYRREIHVWLTQVDHENSALMILMAYILLGHPDWKDGEIRMFTIASDENLEAEEERLALTIREGRLPIARSNIEVISQGSDTDRRELIVERSADADLIIMGFRGELLRRKRTELFQGYEGLGNMLFINTTKAIEIDRPESELDQNLAEDKDEPEKVLTPSADKKATEKDASGELPGARPDVAGEEGREGAQAPPRRLARPESSGE